MMWSWHSHRDELLWSQLSLIFILTLYMRISRSWSFIKTINPVGKDLWILEPQTQPYANNYSPKSYLVNIYNGSIHNWYALIPWYPRIMTFLVAIMVPFTSKICFNSSSDLCVSAQILLKKDYFWDRNIQGLCIGVTCILRLYFKTPRITQFSVNRSKQNKSC